MWLAAAVPSLARRLLLLGPPPPPLLLLLLSRSSRRRRRCLHSLGLAAMPEKRPFERLPAEVSPINYSLCLKPDLLDFTFEGKLEAAAQVLRPSGARGEQRAAEQLGRARGLGWRLGRAGRVGRGTEREAGAARPSRLACWAPAGRGPRCGSRRAKGGRCAPRASTPECSAPGPRLPGRSFGRGWVGGGELEGGTTARSVAALRTAFSPGRPFTPPGIDWKGRSSGT